jgi:DMSO/TMAO reductase YedYZ heme-binding membrane subunit
MTWITATASVVVGLTLASRAVRARTGPWFLDLHRFLGGISVVFLAAHMATLWADSFVEFGPRELFVPGASEWRPEAIAWGIIAAYLLIAIEVSSLLRSRISRKLWRVIHFLSFVAMAGGSYHAWLAGSDVKNPVTWVIAGIGSLLVLGLISMRMQRQDPDDPGPTGISANRAILEEMRQRLEELPIPESTPQPQISLVQDHSLPRRAPVLDSVPEPEPTAPDTGAFTDAPRFSDDPFDALPPASAEPAAGDPFSAPTTPALESTPLPSRPIAPRDTWAADGADLFENIASDPFEDLGVTPAPAPEGFPELPPLAEKQDLFASAVDDPSAEPFSGPFTAVAPTPQSGPPPLPDAVDPVTGEPDEAAYTEWLKEWLTYAEQYGEKAPDDPSRV